MNHFIIPQEKMFDVNTSHPLIPNSQQYHYYKKYVSIHSEDRDITKYPNSSSFEIELPEDYLNVVSVRLCNWIFPNHYNFFTSSNGNIMMTFKFTSSIYNPNTNGVTDPIVVLIYNALASNINGEYSISITEGSYTPLQMANELTNKFNEAVTKYIISYINANPGLYPTPSTTILAFMNAGGYNKFVIALNDVSQKLWFANKSDGFILTTQQHCIDSLCNPCSNNNCPPDNQLLKEKLPDLCLYGLPSHLGLSKNNMYSAGNAGNTYLRFYYGDYIAGDNGYWITTDASYVGSFISYIESPYKINVAGPNYFYVEVDGLNCIDETSVYNLSTFTQQNNLTNGIVNSALAKIPVPTNKCCPSQWMDKEAPFYKYFTPPAERIRKMKIKVRYHNGKLVNFDNLNYSLLIEFVLYVPQQLRQYNLFQPKLGKPIH